MNAFRIEWNSNKSPEAKSVGCRYYNRSTGLEYLFCRNKEKTWIVKMLNNFTSQHNIKFPQLLWIKSFCVSDCNIGHIMMLLKPGHCFFVYIQPKAKF